MFATMQAVGRRPRFHAWLAATAGLALGLVAAAPAKAQDTIKIGILHSLSGTMAISETTLKDVMLMLIDEQNKKGGVLGKKLEAGCWPAPTMCIRAPPIRSSRPISSRTGSRATTS
jgi:urea transport system substrate-binding protein